MRLRILRAFLTPLTFSLAVGSMCMVSGCSSTGSSSIDGENGDGSLSENDLNSQREGRFGNGGIPTAEGEGLFRDIHFGYDSAAIDEEGRADLAYNAKVLDRESSISITLEGHCDERGTVEYNMALGAERARSVKNALAALGVSARRIDTVSYGEEVPLDPNHDETAYEKNRRVHFSASSSAGQNGGSKGRKGSMQY